MSLLLRSKSVLMQSHDLKEALDFLEVGIGHLQGRLLSAAGDNFGDVPPAHNEQLSVELYKLLLERLKVVTSVSPGKDVLEANLDFVRRVRISFSSF